MTAHEARICLRQKIRSSGGLAILVVGKQATSVDPCITVPAHWKKNGEPTVLKAALANFGDKTISFQPQMPTLDVPKIEATAVEFSIIRKHTAAWADTSLPLNYIGKHVTVLRGPNLLSYWALKTFGDNRLPCPHSKATAWRGFFKVADCWTTSLSSQVLLASFSHPKVLITRPTPASFLCPWPLAHWRMHGSALLIVSISPGVALSGDKFAIRCKREHADQVSLHLMPHTLIALLLTQASWFGCC